MDTAEMLRSAYQDRMRELRDSRLIAVGDSQSLLFAANQKKIRDFTVPDLLGPQIRTSYLGPILIWTLNQASSTLNGRARTLGVLEGARDVGFEGWLLLCLGTVDLHFHLPKYVPKIGIMNAVREVADRYLAFIDEARSIYPRIAIWGVPGAVPEARSAETRSAFEIHFPEHAVLGLEVDRNLSVVMFNQYLASKLEKWNVPFISLHDIIVQEDGFTYSDYLYDGVHVSEDLLPYALDLVDARLDLGLSIADLLLLCDKQDLWSVEDLSRTFLNGGNFLQIDFPKYQYIDELCVEGKIMTSVSCNAILSINHETADSQEMHNQLDLREGVCALPIKKWVKSASLRVVGGDLEITSLRLRGRRGYLSHLPENGRGSKHFTRLSRLYTETLLINPEPRNIHASRSLVKDLY